MLIEADAIEKSFGQVRAVRGISLKVDRGERVGILGANGAGKSTTLRMLAGALAPDRGEARIAGIDVVREPLDARAHLGYLPEAAQGFGELTVVEFLDFAAEARGMSGRGRSQAVARVVELLDMSEAAYRSLQTLSKGWRQRAWLAQALIHDPPVLILDEPTDGLDPNQKVVLRDLLRSLAKDKAMLISTHILEEAETLCDRVIIIAGGRVVADAKTSELVDEKGRLGQTFARLTEISGASADVGHAT